MVLVENSPINKVTDILLVTFGEVKHSLGISLGCLPQSFSFGILTNALQNGSDSSGQFLNTIVKLFGRRLQARSRSRAYQSKVSGSETICDDSETVFDLHGQLRPSKSMGGNNV